MGWVTERHLCTLDLAFADIRDAIIADVNEANTRLSEDQRKTRGFHLDPGNNGHRRFAVTGFPIERSIGSDKYTFIFELDKEQIRICRNGPQTLPKPQPPVIVVTQRWDFATASCILCKDGKAVSAQQVSQIALEPMFFGV